MSFVGIVGCVAFAIIGRRGFLTEAVYERVGWVCKVFIWVEYFKDYFRHGRKHYHHQMGFACFHQINSLDLVFMALNSLVDPSTTTSKSFESSMSFMSSESFMKQVNFFTTSDSAQFSSLAYKCSTQSSFICACLADLNR